MSRRALVAGRAAAAVIAVVLVFLPGLGVEVYWLREIELIAIYTMLVGGLNITFGYAGELALSQIASLATGAYLAGILSQHGVQDLAVDFVLAIVAGTLVGVITGVPGLRLGSWSLGLVSLFLLLIIPNIINLIPGVTGGAQGIAGILDPTFFGGALSNTGLYIVCILVAVVWLLCMRNIVTSPYGQALQTLRQSEHLAASVGLPVTRLKLSAYITGNIPAALAGVLYAFLVGFITPTQFSFSLAVAILAASILGGSASIYGAPLGAALLVLGPLRASSFQNYSTMAYGLFLVLIGIVFRGGIASLGRYLSARADRAMTARRDAAPTDGQSLASSGRDGAHPPEVSGLGSLPGQLLTLSGVGKHFGGVAALNDVSLTASPGTITAIIGPNGAGKTTLLNAISSFFAVDQGEIQLGENRLTDARADRVAHLGVARTFQTPRIQSGMTVLEVAQSGGLAARWPSILSGMLRLRGNRRAVTTSHEAATAALALSGLDTQAARPAAQLPLGTRRLLEVARSVVSRPAVVLLDEPAAGLDARSLQHLEDLIRQVARLGATVLLVEHNVPFVFRLADRVVVLEFGQVIAEGVPADIQASARVRQSYLGEQVDWPATSPAGSDAPSPPALADRNMKGAVDG